MRKICLLIMIVWGGKGIAQVNLPTGSATYSLPIFSWQDNKSRLNSVVELDYNSGNGLKVNDVASNVGQGWNLIQGGVVSRIQVGEPDDQKEYFSTTPEQVEDIKKYPNGFLYRSSPYFQYPGCDVSLTKYPIFGDRNHLYKQFNNVANDKEADYFTFSFNGRTGMFVLDGINVNSSSTTCNGIIIGDSKLKIWCALNDMTTQNIRTTIDTIFIQDENGLIYTFARHDITQILKVQYCDSKLNATYKQPKLKSGKVVFESSFPDVSIKNPNIINSWYLTEIKDPLTQRVVSFNYNYEAIHADAGITISYYDPKNYSVISHIFSYSQSPKIATINFPDGHQVLFNYGAERVDMKGDNILSSIDVKYQNRFISKYNLNSSYIIKNRFGKPVSDIEKKWARLYLRSVKKYSVDLKGEEKPYVFDYFLGSSATDDYVPPPFYHIKDVWGYYNGDKNYEANGTTPINLDQPLENFSNVQLKGLCFLRDGVQGIIFNPKPGYAKNGLLRQITYPTGGSLNYDYGQNEIYNGTQNVLSGGVHVINTTITDGGYSNDCNHPVVTSYNYSMDNSNSQSSLWGAETPLSSMTIQNHYSPEQRYFHAISLSCKYHYQYPGILSNDQAVSLTTGQQILGMASNIASVVGTVSEVIDIIKLAAGVTGPGMVIIDVISTLINIGISCFLNPAKDNSMTIYYNSDLNSSNPLPAQFKKLQVVENSGSNGKTVYDFTSSDDYPLWAATNPSFSMKQRFPSWAYGLTKKITIYDASGIYPVQQTENVYDAAYLKEDILYMGVPKVECTKCLVTASASQNAKSWTEATKPTITGTSVNLTYEKMTVDNYNIYSGRLPLQTTYERVFKPGSATQYLETSTQYTYNDNYLVNNITTTQSNGDKNYKTINYNNSLLTSHNIIATPSETATSFMKSGSSTTYYTGESITEFTTIANGNIVPSSTLVQRFSSPVVSTSMKFYPDPGAVYNTTQTFTYDAFSNLTGLRDEGNHIVTNIYDYNDKYVIASVINVDPIADKSAYTSFETSNFGNWEYTGTPAYNYNLSVTGTNSFVLSSSNSLISTINSSKPYILSLWATTPVTVTNATLVKTVNNINQFVYYEYKIAPNVASVTISGNANIDEVRLYPQNARMRTISYDPLIGKTSECDENNRITYYEYDELGRLRFIKDESKNIVKMYEYNLKSKVNGCPATYHNLAVSEVFTKNNCAAGYIGGDVIYTIPDSKYTSTISQDDVDQKVQAEFDALGQNYANTNGTCTMLYYNAVLSTTFTKEGCDPGYKGSTYTYTVPYGRFTSTISQADADAQAQDDMDANGQSLANFPGNASCIVDTSPQYIGEDGAPTQCQSNGHRLILVTDVNPNSSSYNQTQWADEGVDPSCPVSCSFVSATGFTVDAGSPANNGTSVSFYLVFHSNSGTTYWYNSNTVAYVTGGCIPSVNRTLTMSESGRSWEVIIATDGSISVRLLSGTPPSGTNDIGLTGGSYNL